MTQYYEKPNTDPYGEIEEDENDFTWGGPSHPRPRGPFRRRKSGPWLPEC